MKRYVLTVECPDGFDLNLCISIDQQIELTPMSEINGLSIPELTAESAGVLCGAIALLLGTAWVFKQVARAISMR